MAQNTIANAWVQIMPSFQGGQNALSQQMNGPMDRAGRDGGRRFGGAMSGAIGGLATKMFAPLAAAAAAVSIVPFLKGAVDQASGLQEAGTKLNAIFGTEGTAAVQEFAAQGAKALGQNKLAVLDAAATFGTFGKAAGLSGVDLAEFSTGFAGLSTDLASFHNTSPEEAMEAIGSALRGEAEPMRKFGVLLDDASLRAEALKLGLISTTKDALTPQQKVLAAQALIYKQTSDAQGDFERTSGGLANQQRILSAQFTDLKGRIGTALLPVVTKFVTFLNNSLVPGIEKAAAFLAPVGDAVKRLFTAFKGSGEVSKFGTFLSGTIVPALKQFGEYLKANVLPVLIQFGQFMIAKIVPALKALGQFVLTTVVPALVSLGTTIASKIGPILSALWTQFQANILPALQQLFTVITTKVVPVLIRVGQVLVPVIVWIGKLVANILGWLIPALINVAGPVIGFLIKAIGAVIGWVVKFIGWLLDLGQNVKAWAQNAVAKFLDFKDRAIFAFLALQVRARQIFEQIKAWIVARIADVVSTAMQIITFKDRVVAAFTALKNEAINRVSTLVSDVRALPGKILAAVGNLAGTLKQKGRDLIQGLIDGISEKIQAVRNKISEVASAIGDFLPGSPVKEGPLRKWNNGMAGKRLVGMLADGLTDTARVDQAMRGLTSSIATPRLSGTVTGAFGAAGGGETVITIPLYLDGQIVAQNQVRHLGTLAESGAW